MSGSMTHSTTPKPVEHDRLQRGEVLLEKDAQGSVTVLRFDGAALRQARNNDQFAELVQDYLASASPGRYTCSPELAIRAQFDD
jgi:hypothetical protein